MTRTTLGRTGLSVCRDGMGALPIQRLSKPNAVRLLHRARDAGIDFYDTARVYTDSEEKLGAAFGGAWGGLVLATKSMGTTPAAVRRDLEQSLRLLKRDHVDIFQFHNPAFCPLPGDGSGLYEAVDEARKAGLVRFIGLTGHLVKNVEAAVQSGLYDTVQYPFSCLSLPHEEALVRRCAAANVGFIAMKALAGGLLADIGAARAWLGGFPNAVPIWGIQHESELDALVAAMAGPAAPTQEQLRRIEQDRRELQGSFCRACGYCMPCPAGIEINSCARVMLLMRRFPEDFYAPAWREKMEKVEACTLCGRCAQRCPYRLNTPRLLRENREAYVAAMPK